jgi:hypothetical protein
MRLPWNNNPPCCELLKILAIKKNLVTRNFFVPLHSKIFFNEESVFLNQAFYAAI